ncbi:coproporphyrinogen-III oxidase family protein [Streptomyces sp. YS415]|uniref:coproporphyrinogen-III oxidase family protein n=1 Tax=Streptomyces sp. YS415 TaxID=2944806 RepID=UPI002020731D|nr:radical SAM protein [Streptomyces sp. YS415]MCL7430088.1 radical SAM protein [Streptomyces sp. YS415]
MSKTVASAGTTAVRPGTGLARLLQENPALRIGQDDYNINVTANYGDRLDPDEVAGALRAHPGAGRPAHLYFHVPLCAYICHFCNYVKRKMPGGAEGERASQLWTDLLIEESTRRLAHAPWLSGARIESVYLGGGTASLLGTEQLARLAGHMRDNYALTDDCEISLEGNPDNFLHDELAEACAIGFNRFSVGVQSLQSEVNAFAGRGHDAQMSLRAIEKLRATGRPFNVDMMFGLPHQTPGKVAHDIRTLIDLKAPTITIYRLRNADRAKMGIGNRALWNVESVRDRLRAEHLFPGLDETYEMREAIVELLLDGGYHPSPCGWWNRPGIYPDGNIPRVSRNKWQRHDSMIAYGPGAYGWLTGDDDTVVQTHNIADISGYARHLQDGPGLPLAFGRRLAGAEAIGMVLGFAFKANQPIDAARFRRRFGIELFHDEPFAGVFTELLERGLVEPVPGAGESVVPTLDGEALHEEIISVYFHQRIGSFAEAVCRR